MSDINPEHFAEFATQDGPGSADVDPAGTDAASTAAAAGADRTPSGHEHPEHEAHGGSMAPGLVDDAGRPNASTD